MEIKMEKTNKLLACALIVALLTLALFGCSAGTKNGTATIVIAGEETNEYELKIENLESATVHGALLYLKEHNGIAYEYVGTMVTEAGELKNDDAAYKWIYFWTSVESDFDVSEWASTVEFAGRELVSSGVSAMEMSLVDGAIIYIGYYE